MENDLIERVARAMCRQVEQDTDKPGEQPSWEYLGFANLDAWVDDTWPAYVKQARAGLAAMRVPADAMKRKASRDAAQGHMELTEGGAQWIWEMMIDAALAPTTSSSTAP